MESRIKKSAYNVLKENLQLKNNEEVLLIFDNSTYELSEAFKLAANELSIKINTVEIEKPGEHGRNPDGLGNIMNKYPVIIAATFYSMTHCSATHDALKHGARIATLPGITKEIFTRGLSADSIQLKESGDKWLKHLNGNCELCVKTDAGTDISFNSGKYSFQNDSGIITEPGTVGNLPAGEVFVAPDPESANGKLMIDGTIGGQKWNENKSPAEIIIKNGYAVSFKGSRAEKLAETLDFSKNAKAAFFLAEFGIGTNPKAQMSGNLLEDEKVKGTVHFAFGDNCSFGGKNSVPVHIDCLVLEPDISYNNKILMENGVWKI